MTRPDPHNWQQHAEHAEHLRQPERRKWSMKRKIALAVSTAFLLMFTTAEQAGCQRQAPEGKNCRIEVRQMGKTQIPVRVCD